MALVDKEGAIRIIETIDKELYELDRFVIWQENSCERLFRVMDNRIQITSDGQNSLYIIADKLEYLIKRDWIT